jgi:hypothetical protein
MPSFKGLTFAASAVVLISLAAAAPIDSTNTSLKVADPDFKLQATSGKSSDQCGASTFTNKSSPASPTVSDCLQIAADIADGGKTWEVTVDAQVKLASSGTCAFGGEAISGSGPWEAFFYVGNQDIVELIHSSIDLYEWNGLIGAMGEMWCSPREAEHVRWGIYHT